MKRGGGSVMRPELGLYRPREMWVTLNPTHPVYFPSRALLREQLKNRQSNPHDSQNKSHATERDVAQEQQLRLVTSSLMSRLKSDSR